MTRSNKSLNCPLDLQLFVFFLLAFLSLSSGIIASSDGITIFNVTQAIVERGEISVGGENVAVGVGGKHYSRYGIALSVLAIPLYSVGKLVSFFVPAHLEDLFLKGSASLTNVLISALASLLFFLVGQKLSYPPRVSLLLTLGFAFSTFFVVYATKSFFTQPLETLCLVGTLYFLISHSQALRSKSVVCAGCLSGVGVLTKLVFVINMPVFLAYLLATAERGRRVRDVIAFCVPVVGSLALALGYNHARFGSFLRTGYFGLEGFSTPLLVGLYGLLFSSGKSLFLYAPIVILGWVSMKAFARSHKREMWMCVGLFTVNLLLIAMYRDWGGEGSWGPRYLTLVLPCLVLPIGALLERGSVAVRRVFLALSLAGLLVQFGGVSIFYGTYYRVIGEYPYQADVTDPPFLVKAHYVPNYSPAWGHLKMAGQNWAKFLAGQKPTFSIINPERKRVPLAEPDIEKLQETLDLWFAYAYYAGVPFGLCLLGMTSLLAVALTTGWSLYRSTADKHDDEGCRDLRLFEKD